MRPPGIAFTGDRLLAAVMPESGGQTPKRNEASSSSELPRTTWWTETEQALADTLFVAAVTCAACVLLYLVLRRVRCLRDRVYAPRRREAEAALLDEPSGGKGGPRPPPSAFGDGGLEGHLLRRFIWFNLWFFILATVVVMPALMALCLTLELELPPPKPPTYASGAAAALAALRERVLLAVPGNATLLADAAAAASAAAQMLNSTAHNVLLDLDGALGYGADAISQAAPGMAPWAEAVRNASSTLLDGDERPLLDRMGAPDFLQRVQEIFRGGERTASHLFGDDGAKDEKWTLLHTLTIERIPSRSPRLWGSAVMMVLLTAHYLFRLRKEWAAYVVSRHAWLAEMGVHHRAVVLHCVGHEVIDTSWLLRRLQPMSPWGEQLLAAARLDDRPASATLCDAFSPSPNETWYAFVETQQHAPHAHHVAGAKFRTDAKAEEEASAYGADGGGAADDAAGGGGGGAATCSSRAAPSSSDLRARLISEHLDSTERASQLAAPPAPSAPLPSVTLPPVHEARRDGVPWGARHTCCGEEIRVDTRFLVLYAQRQAAHLCAAASSWQLFGPEVQTHAEPAPSPCDMYWPNVLAPAGWLRLTRFFADALTLLLFLFWTIPVAFVQAMATVTNLAKLPSLAWLARWLDASGPAMVASFEGSVASFTLIFFRALTLYSGLFQLLMRLRGETTHTALQAGSGALMMLFQLLLVLLASLVASSLFDLLWEIVEKPLQLPVLLAGKLPHQSTFFVNFIVLQIAFALPLDLLQLGPLCLEALQFGCCCCFGCARRGGERWAEWLMKTDYRLLYIYARVVLVVSVGVVFACVAPLVLPFTLAFLAVAAPLYTANMRLVYAPPMVDTGGSLWEAATFYESAALAIAQLLLGGMQLSKEHPAGALLCALCFFATLVRDRTLRNHYGALAKRLPLERLREIDDAERRAGLRHTLSDFAVEYQGPWS